MGSDADPIDLYQAVVQLLQKGVDADFVLFASDEIKASLDPSLTVVAGSEVIAMDDNPIQAVRQKKESSLCLGIQYLQEKKIDGFVTAGNTGALLLSAKTTLKTLPGIDRPALLALLPTQRQPIAVLDVGANLTLKSKHIVQFAAMGIAYQKSRGVLNPTVGLLNVGTEAKKGTPQMREAYGQLETLNRDRRTFVGNIEGKAVFHGEIDVVVTDGFTGNVFLKTAEGIAAFIIEQLELSSKNSTFTHLANELVNLRQRLHIAEHPGAILCGVDGVVVKCHGDVTSESFMQGIQGALRLVQHQFLDKIKSQLVF